MAIVGHSEMITFDVAPLGKHNIILGLPWLQHHSPIIQWASRKITFLSDYCKEHCLATSASAFLCQKPVMPTTIPKPDPCEADPEAELMLIEGAGISALEIPDHLTALKDAIPKAYWDF